MNVHQLSPTVSGNRPSTKAQGGFSLIEVVIALAILSFGLLAVVAMQSTSVQNKTVSNGISQAMREVNQSTAEWLLSLSMDDTNLDAGTHGPATSADGVYETSYTVGSGTPGLKEVVVTTTWTDFKGAHSVDLTFIKDSTL